MGGGTGQDGGSPGQTRPPDTQPGEGPLCHSQDVRKAVGGGTWGGISGGRG